MKILHDSFFKWWIEHERHKKYAALIFDIDGTLAAGPKTLPGAAELILWLRKNKFPFQLLTNDGNHSTEEKSASLKKAGLGIEPADIVSCSSVLGSFVRKNNLDGARFFVMGDLGEPCYAITAGLQVERNTKKIYGCDGIIVGEGNYDWQENISAAMNYFCKKPSAYFIVPNPDSYWPNGPHGEIGVGAGGKARFICSILDERGVKIKPSYFGKPYNAVFRRALELLRERYDLKKGVRKEKIIMLGDSLRSDILGANKFGLSSALLLTGITEEKQLKKARGLLAPDLVFRSLG